MDKPRKVFSEQEAGEIVRRAATLQEQAHGSSYTPGITSEELKKVAREVGVEPKYLEMAIMESLAPESRKGLFNLTEEFERVVDGELEQEDFDLILENLRPGMHRAPLTQVGRTVSGSARSGAVSTATVKVTSRNGRTKIGVKSSPILAYLIGLHPAVIGSFIAMGALGEKGYVAAGLGLAAGLLAAGGLAFKKLVSVGNENARKLADSLASKVIEETSAKAESEAAPEAVRTGESEEADQVRQRLI